MNNRRKVYCFSFSTSSSSSTIESKGGILILDLGFNTTSLTGMNRVEGLSPKTILQQLIISNVSLHTGGGNIHNENCSREFMLYQKTYYKIIFSAEHGYIPASGCSGGFPTWLWLPARPVCGWPQESSDGRTATAAG